MLDFGKNHKYDFCTTPTYLVLRVYRVDSENGKECKDGVGTLGRYVRCWDTRYLDHKLSILLWKTNQILKFPHG